VGLIRGLQAATGATGFSRRPPHAPLSLAAFEFLHRLKGFIGQIHDQRAIRIAGCLPIFWDQSELRAREIGAGGNQG